jgi:acetylglutamate kinase
MSIFVIKAGGRAAESSESIAALAVEISDLVQKGHHIVFVHGGGAAVSAIQKQYELEPRFVDGKRLTSAREMDLVDMGLSGLMNTHLVRIFQTAGLKPVGLSGADGSLFLSTDATGEDGNENRTGSVAKVNPTLIGLLLDHEYFPVICSVSTDSCGRGMNINADEAALALAVALNAESLIFISDIPGILIEGTVVPSMNEQFIEDSIGNGEIQGGMIPKVRSSLEAIRQGVHNIQISNYENQGDLSKIIARIKGTCITLEDK